MTSPAPTIHVGRDQYHLAWDRAIEPVATVASGTVVEIEMLDASCGQITSASTADDLRTLDFSRVNPAHGPIAVEGAEPGDSLEIELLDFQPAGWGWTASIPGFGLLADDFPDPALRITPLLGETAAFLPGISVPLAPFCGGLGVAPAGAGPHSTIPPSLWPSRPSACEFTADADEDDDALAEASAEATPWPTPQVTDPPELAAVLYEQQLIEFREAAASEDDAGGTDDANTANLVSVLAGLIGLVLVAVTLLWPKFPVGIRSGFQDWLEPLE